MLLGRMLAGLGCSAPHGWLETDRGGVVAGCVGQTAIKITEKIKDARDGVLFIDEAYTLLGGKDQGYDFGNEAIETLLKLMEDNRRVSWTIGVPSRTDRRH